MAAERSAQPPPDAGGESESHEQAAQPAVAPVSPVDYDLIMSTDDVLADDPSTRRHLAGLLGTDRLEEEPPQNGRPESPQRMWKIVVRDGVFLPTLMVPPEAAVGYVAHSPGVWRYLDSDHGDHGDEPAQEHLG